MATGPHGPADTVVTSPAHQPRCSHFGACGGCDLQHVAYSEQLRLKRERLVECLQGLVPAALVRPCLAVETPDAPWGLRRKVHFVLTNDDGHLRLAHHGKRTRRAVPITECPVHASGGNRLADELCQALDRAGVAAFPDGPVRHIVVRDPRSGRPPIVTLVVDEDGDARVRRAVGRFLDAQSGRVSVFVNINGDDTPYIFGRETRHLAGPRRSTEQVNGMDYVLSATSFFQTNVDAAEILVRLVLDAAGRAHSGSRAVDLYAGAGLFALQLARAGFRVLAVEENPSAIADGMASARENRISPGHCQFVRAPVRRFESWSRHLRGPAEVLVLDPPRVGAGAALLRDILAHLRPARVVYVSCDPESLAQDLAAFVSPGRKASAYQIESVQPVDMFPQTTHVEAVVTIRATREARAHL